MPDALSDALHCPVPYIMGVTKLDEELRGMLDVVILDVDRDEIHMPSFPIPPLVSLIVLCV